ncbi:hypothetical protein [Nocardia huaxiensis]|uniref:hypothetical protein n=1 Tax=Nocardia huaxiensis TaxID=2755382 RepID=UPI001E3D800E|nr:hypothetical protein [Nocardia huaxiensis]UFS98503.1 hypothetical protein LPY97_11665 [Nocardia huaxiensis]
MKTRVLLAAAATIASTGVSVFVGTPAAHAQQACGWTVDTSSKQPSNAVMDGPYSSYNLYDGNSTSCSKKPGSTTPEGSSIKVFCTEWNNSGNLWVYIQNQSGVRGWTSRSNIGSWWPSVSNCS